MRRKQSRSRSPSPTSQASKRGFSIFHKSRRATMAKIAITGFCIVLAIILLVQYSSSTVQRAVAVLNGPNGPRGTIRFDQTGTTVRVSGDLTGLRPEGEHGFHVHQFGDLTNGCTSAGSHWNPEGHEHGAPDDHLRHVGDLGNIVADANGNAHINFQDDILTLSGEHSIIGRAVVVHEKPDDLGRGAGPDSKKTGSAGGRLACAIIGWSS